MSATEHAPTAADPAADRAADGPAPGGGPLDGVRVVELAVWVAGPSAAGII